MGDDGDEANGSSAFAHGFLLTQDGVDLANLFPKIPERRVRRRIVELVRAMTDEPTSDEG